MPAWKRLTAVAPTLVYDISIVEPNQKGLALTTGQWTIKVPTLVVDGGKSPAWMRNGMRALAGVLPTSLGHDPRRPDAHGEVRGAGRQC